MPPQSLSRPSAAVLVLDYTYLGAMLLPRAFAHLGLALAILDYAHTELTLLTRSLC